MTYRNLAIELKDDGKLHIKDIADPLDLWEATRRFFKEKRKVLTSTTRHGWTYPETTNGDVRQLAEVWTRVHKQLWRSDLARAKQHRDEWNEARSQIEIATAGADPAAIFGENETFWLRWTKRQAIYLSAVRDMPSKWEMVVDSVKDSVKRLPENLASGAEAVADAGAAVGMKAGEVVTAPVRGVFNGLFGKLGTPLLIAGAVVGGAIVVPKLLARRSPAAPPPGGGVA
ncbi:MAG: hypothetical protein F9K40_20445 [Kofleriaceae bacterium]|nr:MAG: hypothetical protein F9K40_20445 [Kofleriaceae bacterium]